MRIIKRLGFVAGVCALIAGAGLPSSAVAQAKEAPTVALSNAFLGNAWRRSMITAFEEAAEKAQADGLISSYQVSNAPGENSATEQIAQLKALLLDQPDILLVNPASPTALNPTLQQACNLDIVVVVFDSATDLECAYLVTNSFGDWARLSTQAIIDGIGGKGNVVLARGVQGSPPEIEMYEVQKAMLDDNPDVKVVAEVFTFCDSAKAQEALLGTIASLPDVDGIIGCGEGLGAVQAFQTAGRELPVVTKKRIARPFRQGHLPNQRMTGRKHDAADPLCGHRAQRSGRSFRAARNGPRWSDIPNNRKRECGAATDVEFTNGRTLDLNGSVVQCSHGRRRVERDRGGVITSIVDEWNGVRLNSRNDGAIAPPKLYRHRRCGVERCGDVMFRKENPRQRA